jgi:hypothetical protein
MARRMCASIFSLNKTLCATVLSNKARGMQPGFEARSLECETPNLLDFSRSHNVLLQISGYAIKNNLVVLTRFQERKNRGGNIIKSIKKLSAYRAFKTCRSCSK